MPATFDHHLKHHRERAEAFRAKFREEFDFEKLPSFVEQFIQTEEEIMAATILEVANAAKTVIDAQAATIADLTTKLAAATTVDAPTQTAVDALAAEPAVVAILMPIAPAASNDSTGTLNTSTGATV